MKAMKGKILNRLCFCLLAFGFFCTAALGSETGDPAQNVFVAQEIYLSLVFRAYRYHHSREEYPQAAAELNKILSLYPGGENEAAARLLLADGFLQQEDYASALDQYRLLEQHFPASSYSLIGKACRLQLETPRPQDFLKRLDELIKSAGGKSCLELAASPAKDESFPREAIPPSYRDPLAQFYYWAALDYGERGFVSAKWKILLFVRENFPGYRGDDVLTPIAEDILNARHLPWDAPFSPLAPLPKGGVVYPPDGAYIGSPTPRIEFELKAGDILGPRIDLSALTFTLDGEDLTPKMGIKSQLNTSARPGTPFETLRIYYRPPVDLPPGRHQVRVKVEDTQGGEGTLSWDFFVKP